MEFLKEAVGVAIARKRYWLIPTIVVLAAVRFLFPK
jgi:hypothetical protein